MLGNVYVFSSFSCSSLCTSFKLYLIYPSCPDFKPARERECEKPCVEKTTSDKPHVYQQEDKTDSYSSEYPQLERPGRSNSLQTKGLAETETKGGSVAQSPLMSRAITDVEWVVDQWTSCKLVPGTL